MTAIISQPMNCKAEDQIRAERKKAIMYLNDKGYEVVDTVLPDFVNEGNVPLKYLAKFIEAMADTDLVYVIGDWKNARNCRIVVECCILYNIRIEIDEVQK
jgi:mRNA-degrading endonuclease YafQ of YafQ-DinJ toxin-antitoxin module